MFKYKIVTEYKYMKRAVRINEPDTQNIGKIDITDIHNSAIPLEIYHLSPEKIKVLKRGKTIAVSVKTITTVYLTKE